MISIGSLPRRMAKERGDRYQSAEALAVDIERHLQHLPVTAKRPSAIGRARKFAQRHKIPVLLSLMFFFASAIRHRFSGSRLRWKRCAGQAAARFNGQSR